MAEEIIQFVDSISASPTVLFDVTSAFKIKPGTSFTPPPVRRTNTWTALADGTTETTPTWDDRTIVLVLSAYTGTAMEQATAFQQLARIVASPALLRVQMPGMASPLFFQTRRADATIVDLLLTANPQRDITLTLPAMPFGRGLRETGQLTIRNHPLSGTNRMCAVLPPAKGDVPTPLELEFVTPAKHPNYDVSKFRSVVASAPVSRFGNTASITTAVNSSGAGAVQANVTRATDSTMATGSRIRIAPTGSSSRVLLPLEFTVPAAGNYRVFVRANIANNNPSNTPTIALGNAESQLLRTDTAFPTGSPEYFDLGVTWLPQRTVVGGDQFGLIPSQTTVRLDAVITHGASGGYVDLDMFVLVPADMGCKVASQSTTALSPQAPRFSNDVRLTLDGVNDIRYATWTATDGYGLRSWHVGDLDGSLPQIHPGAGTRLTILPVVRIDGAPMALATQADLPDPLGSDLVVDYLYFPSYLGLKGNE